LCCLTFFNLRLLITPLVSSNISFDYMQEENTNEKKSGKIISLGGQRWNLT
jgi:hypothetical protein